MDEPVEGFCDARVAAEYVGLSHANFRRLAWKGRVRRRVIGPYKIFEYAALDELKAILDAGENPPVVS